MIHSPKVYTSCCCTQGTVPLHRARESEKTHHYYILPWSLACPSIEEEDEASTCGPLPHAAGGYPREVSHVMLAGATRLQLPAIPEKKTAVMVKCLRFCGLLLLSGLVSLLSHPFPDRQLGHVAWMPQDHWKSVWPQTAMMFHHFHRVSNRLRNQRLHFTGHGRSLYTEVPIPGEDHLGLAKEELAVCVLDTIARGEQKTSFQSPWIGSRRAHGNRSVRTSHSVFASRPGRISVRPSWKMMTFMRREHTGGMLSPLIDTHSGMIWLEFIFFMKKRPFQRNLLIRMFLQGQQG